MKNRKCSMETIPLGNTNTFFLFNDMYSENL